MKILGVCGSPRKGKTSFFMLEQCLTAVRETDLGIKTELLELAGMKINGCLACGQCLKELKCSQEDDFAGVIPLLSDPELAGLIIATPVYLGSMTSQCKAFLDRGVMFRRNGFMLSNKVGGVIAVGGFRNGGQELTIQTVQAAMLIQNMIIVGDNRPTAHFGGTAWSAHPGGIEQDTVGLDTVRNLGKRVAEVAAKMHG
ncbi:MAG: flavodoxin family protein [Desulfobacca sp.]|nr:flavodoxin family protein [Desulfobacca sp.]